MGEGAALISLIYSGAAVAGVATAIFAARRREEPGGRTLAAMMVAVAFWALCDALEVRAGSVAEKRWISQVQYLGVVACAPLFFHAALDLARVRRRLSLLERAAIWLVPGITLALAWTSSRHGWIWSAIEAPRPGSPFAVYRYGPWFWVFTVHGYLLLALGSAIVLAAARRANPPHRGQLRVVAISLALPWLGNVLYVFKLGPWPGFNWLDLAFVAFGAIVAWEVAGAGLLDLLPRAREAILERMSDGVLVVDVSGRVLLANTAANALLGGTTPLARLPAGLPEPALAAGSAVPQVVGFESAAGRRSIELRTDPLLDRWGAPAGRIYVLRDVTARRALELDQERLIEELRRAVAEVHKLEGLLPICAWCKKVRDDRGYWSQIESYLEQHSPIEFSHGLCPDCETRYFSEGIAGGPGDVERGGRPG